jgi:DNA-binding NarL/FixJ family response regulator
MVADGLAAVWGREPGLRVTGIAHDVASAVPTVSRLRPHVAVVDYNLPDGDGADLTARLLAEHPSLRVLVLTGLCTTEVAGRVRRAGAHGIVFKTAHLPEFTAAVRRVAAGGEHYPDGVRDPVEDGVDGRTRELSSRELEVLTLVARGARVDTIAAELVLSPHTVRNHIRNILVKLGAHSKLEAVSMAVRAGLIRLD